jgi:nicotinamidase-related amidase
VPAYHRYDQRIQIPRSRTHVPRGSVGGREDYRIESPHEAAALPTIYINDNFGQWRSNLPQLVQKCLSAQCRGRAIVQHLQPDEKDYIVLKPRHSGFFGTPLELLLTFVGARRLIITGIATDSCILYTAADAYMRDYELIVPSDCVTTVNPEAHGHALHHMQTMLKANTCRSSTLRIVNSL